MGGQEALRPASRELAVATAPNGGPWDDLTRNAPWRSSMFKTTAASTPDEYIEALDEPRRGQVRDLHELIRRTAPDLEPRIESGMLAYGHYHFRYASGREGDWFPIGLASNKRYISLYVTAADPQHGYLAESYRDRLPKADIGRSCVRIKRLGDVDLDVLTELIAAGARASDPG